MSFIVVCVDKENPKESEIVPVEPTDAALAKGEDLEPADAQIFPTKQNADRWVTEDEKEFPGVYDYHIIQVG